MFKGLQPIKKFNLPNFKCQTIPLAPCYFNCRFCLTENLCQHCSSQPWPPGIPIDHNFICESDTAHICNPSIQWYADMHDWQDYRENYKRGVLLTPFFLPCSLTDNLNFLLLNISAMYTWNVHTEGWNESSWYHTYTFTTYIHTYILHLYRYAQIYQVMYI